MSRLANAILTSSFAADYVAPMLDMRLGGQNGYAPNLKEWVNNQAYIQRNLVCLLIEAPKGFQYLPDPAFWVGALKSLVELHPKSITGFNAGTKLDFTENAVSGGGEMQQDVTNITRERSIPVMTFIEKYGRPFQTFIAEWHLNLFGDPDSKIPAIATLPGAKPADLLADMSTATMLFFETDPLHQTVYKAWLTTNMAPEQTGDIIGKRELSAAMDQLEISITWSGISQSSLGVRLFAQGLLDAINITNANPNLAPAFVSKVDPDLSSTSTVDGGYQAGAQTLGTNAQGTKTIAEGITGGV